MGTREKILKAALKLALTVGYENTSLSRIASEVGISKPAIYHHFKNKEELFQQALDFFLDNLSGFSYRLLGEQPDFRSFLRTFLTSTAKIKDYIFYELLELQSPPAFTFLELNIGAGKHNLETRKRMALGHLQTRKHFVRLINKAIVDGEIRGDIDAEATANIILSMLEGLSLQKWFNSDLDQSREGEEIFDTFWQMIKK